MALVECIYCEKRKKIRARDLKHKKTNSCRCQIIKHNLSNSKIYSVYHNMKDRCYNSNCHAYKDYGGKGIIICDEWLKENGFLNFYNWSIKNGYNINLSIDRIDELGNYEPDNCQWIILSENVAKANKVNHRNHNKNGKYFGISPNNQRYEFDNAAKFAEQVNLNANMIRKSAKNNKVYRNWSFGYIKEDINIEI